MDPHSYHERYLTISLDHEVKFGKSTSAGAEIQDAKGRRRRSRRRLLLVSSLDSIIGRSIFGTKISLNNVVGKTSFKTEVGLRYSTPKDS